MSVLIQFVGTCALIGFAFWCGKCVRHAELTDEFTEAYQNLQRGYDAERSEKISWRGAYRTLEGRYNDLLAQQPQRDTHGKFVRRT